MKMKQEKLMILFVLGLLSVPLFNHIIMPVKSFSELENRVLSQGIRWNRDLLKSGVLAERVESYAQDQFPFREALINLKSDVEVLLGKGVNNGVYKGDDGYLFRKPGVYDEEILEENNQAIMTLSAYLKEKLTIIIAPSSSMVLHEKLPDFVTSDQENKYYEFILSELKTTQVIPVIEKLQKHDDEEIFFKTDHHWTQYGAYLSYEELMNSFSMKPVDNINFSVHKINDFQGTLYSRFRGSFIKGEDFVLYETENEEYSVEYIAEERKEDKIIFKENLEKHDKYKVYLDGNYPLIRIRNPHAEHEEKVLVIKDSFANAMVPYLAESFTEVHYMDLRYNNTSLKEYMEKEGFTKVILLYGMDTIGEDPNLKKLAY